MSDRKMKDQHNSKSRSSKKSRRGVGGIIAGVILMAIIFTSVLVFFVTVNNNDKARFGYEIASQDEERQKATEDFAVYDYDSTGSTVTVQIENTGPIPMRASQMLTYCLSGPDCTNPPGVPTITDISATINAGDSITQEISVSTGNAYRVDVISERGNMRTFGCDFDSGECTLPGGGDGGDTQNEIIGAVNEGIVQGTGSLQLDFRAFGAIFPQLATRDGVDQRGWDVTTSSRHGGVTGYPAFEIPNGAHVAFVERVRNLDPSEEDIILTRTTALLTNQGSIPPGRQSFEYICKEDKDNRILGAYHEQNANKVIPATPLTAPPTEGWEEVYFCTTDPGTAYSSNTGYAPEKDRFQLNGIIMIARGVFVPSQALYGQTIPYQAALPGSTAYTTFFWCLYETDTSPNNACPNPGTASSEAQNALLIYTADRETMRSGLEIYAHYRQHQTATLPNPPATITWIHPDGTHEHLTTANINSRNNIPFTLPTTNSDGTPIDCADGSNNEHYTIRITDSYDTDGSRNVYYLTFRMTCS